METTKKIFIFQEKELSHIFLYFRKVIIRTLSYLKLELFTTLIHRTLAYL